MPGFILIINTLISNVTPEYWLWLEIDIGFNPHCVAEGGLKNSVANHTGTSGVYHSNRRVHSKILTELKYTHY